MNLKEQLFNDLNPVNHIPDSAYPNPPEGWTEPEHPEGKISKIELFGIDKNGNKIKIEKLVIKIKWENEFESWLDAFDDDQWVITPIYEWYKSQ